MFSSQLHRLPKLTTVEKSTGSSSVSNSLTIPTQEIILKRFSFLLLYFIILSIWIKMSCSLPFSLYICEFSSSNHTSPQKSSKGASNCVSPQSKTQWKITKKSVSAYWKWLDSDELIILVLPPSNYEHVFDYLLFRIFCLGTKKCIGWFLRMVGYLMELS